MTCAKLLLPEKDLGDCNFFIFTFLLEKEAFNLRVSFSLQKYQGKRELNVKRVDRVAANIQNLKSYTKGDPRASENGKKGAPRAAAARKRNANIAKTMNDLIANRTVTLDGEEITYEVALCLTMVREALSGNVAAAKFVQDAVEGALRSKEVQAKIAKLQAETEALKSQQEDNSQKESVVIIDDIGNQTE